MAKLETATLTIAEDEPAWSLREWNQPVQGVYHRFQEIRVIRNGKVAVWLTDMGTSKSFNDAHGINLVLGNLFEDHRIEVYHNVGQAREMADKARGKPLPDQFYEDEPESWATAYNEEIDRQRMAEKGLLYFTPKGK